MCCQYYSSIKIIFLHVFLKVSIKSIICIITIIYYRNLYYI